MLLFLSIFLLGAAAFADDSVKTPNVSGQFYSADPEKLASDIATFLNNAVVEPPNGKIEILISPHAGYVYSGPVAAFGYKAIRGKPYKTVVIIALSHYSDFEGFSIWPNGAFETPLGKIDVDGEFAKSLMEQNGRVKIFKETFTREHSLETQLPFLQTVLRDFKIVPILTGRPNFDDCMGLASALNGVIGKRDDVLIIVSTDMSHYHDDETAKKMDEKAIQDIRSLDAENLWKGIGERKKELCGFPGVATALLYAKLRGMNKVNVLKYANSGDITDDRDRVVGYSSVVFTKEGEEEMKNENQEAGFLTKEQKQRLIEIARKAIESYIKERKVPDFKESDPRLSYPEGAFVTIHTHGALRGCIGNVIGRGPLFLTVRDMAISSATNDPRFPPLKKEELGDIDIEVSVLSEPRTASIDEIAMGTHGVIVSQGVHHGLFLPQVATETGWSREEFLSQLCAQKAGLPADAWKDPATKIEVFTAQVFSEKDVAE